MKVIVWYARARKIRQLHNWNAFPNCFKVQSKYRMFPGRLSKPFVEILRKFQTKRNLLSFRINYILSHNYAILSHENSHMKLVDRLSSIGKKVAPSYLTQRISTAWYAHSNLIPLVMADTQRKSELQDVELSMPFRYH